MLQHGCVGLTQLGALALAAAHVDVDQHTDHARVTVNPGLDVESGCTLARIHLGCAHSLRARTQLRITLVSPKTKNISLSQVP